MTRRNLLSALLFAPVASVQAVINRSVPSESIYVEGVDAVAERVAINGEQPILSLNDKDGKAFAAWFRPSPQGVRP